MKTYLQVVRKLGDDMYTLHASGAGMQEVALFDEVAMAAYIFDVPREVLRKDIKGYVLKKYGRKL